MGKRTAAPSGSGKAKKRQKKSTDNANVTQTPTEDTPTTNDDENNTDDEEIVDSTEEIKAAKEAIKKQLTKRKSVVYAFFHAEPDIEFGKDNTADYVVYRCINCGEKVRQGMKTGDRGNLREHVKKCWGQEALDAVNDTTLEKAKAAVRESKKKKQTTLTVVVSTVQSWFKSFSTRPPEREKICVVTARWVAESARPFLIVQDHGYRWLQKEGR
ncbi:hypothetical protein EV361DRAFT_874798, partial [Lentinula raphanica]